jgi:hypothetical protein
MNRTVIVALALVSSIASAQTKPIPVTADNFIRAETDWYFGMFAKRGAFGSSFPIASCPRSTCRASAPTATPFIRKPCGTSMPGR